MTSISAGLSKLVFKRLTSSLLRGFHQLKKLVLNLFAKKASIRI